MQALVDAGMDVVQIGVTREGAWLTDGNPLQTLQDGSPLFALADGTVGSGRILDAVESLSLKAASSMAPSIIPANGWAGDLDVIFPVLHGPMGEDGTVQGLFELAGLPYVGAGVMSSSVAMDKSICKQLLAQAGIPQGPWLTVLRKEWERFPESITSDITRELGFPCFVKPANLGSSVGISKAHDVTELTEAMREAGQYDRKIVVEQAIDARELEISILGNDEPTASVIGEVVPSHEFYDYEAKYVDDSSELIIPADIPERVREEVTAVAIRAFRVLDCAGMARVDFFLERRTGRVLLNEINTIPGFTAISMYPKLWEASGLALPQLVSRLVELSIERHAERHGSR
jgi:D-alanine-D-alanine ligase